MIATFDPGFAGSLVREMSFGQLTTPHAAPFSSGHEDRFCAIALTVGNDGIRRQLTLRLFHQVAFQKQ
jgi:hypothetical protein